MSEKTGVGETGVGETGAEDGGGRDAGADDATLPAGGGAGSPGGDGAPAASDDGGRWHAGLSDELRADPAVTKFHSLDGLARGYKELEAYQGRSVAVPDATADAAAWNRVWDRLGRPKDVAGYPAPEIPEGMAHDPEMLRAFTGFAHAHGLTARQYRGLVGDVIAMQHRGQRAAAEARQAALTNGMNALKAKWGDAYEGRAEIARRAMHALGFGAHAATLLEDARFVEQFHDAGAQLGEDRIEGFSRQSLRPTPEGASRRKAKILGDAGHPYHLPDHPGHGAAVAEVYDLNLAITGEQGPGA
jgi:hypothetical protein